MHPLRLIGEVLITACVLLVLFVVYQLWWTDVVAQRKTDAARQELLIEFDMGTAQP